MTLKITFLTLSLLLSTVSLAQQDAENRRPVSSITDATWEKYKDMYSSSPLCSKEEITLWSCETSSKTYSLCSSTHIDKTTGYIQYRVSRNGHTIFTFPNTKIPPVGLFSFQSYANGNASLDFSNGGYDYSLIDPLREESAIFVINKNTQRQSQVSCNGGNQTLQLNYTLRLMFDSGVWSGYY